MSIVGPGTWPLLFHSSLLDHMVHAHMPIPSEWTAALLTIMILVVLRIWALRKSIWVWGWISCHNGLAHSSGGVNKHWCKELCTGWGGVGFCSPWMDNCRCIDCVVMVGVADHSMQCMSMNSWWRPMPSLESDCQNYARQTKRKCHCLVIKYIWCDGYTTEISAKVFILS